MKKTLLVTTVASLMLLFFALGGHQHLTLAGIQAGLAQWQALQTDAPVATAAAFFAGYVLVTALSLPGAAVMTLAAGALFGLGMGLVLVSFASSVGATLAFLASRYLLRDVVEKRFGDKLHTIHQGIAKDGALYLLTLRLVPVVPFFLINLLMGLTNMATWRFYWVSQLGMLTGTAFYVNAGTQLAQISSLQGIMSPTLLTSMALLGVFPLLAKKAVAGWQKRQLLANWKRPARFDRNLVVIGAGAAGLVTSYIAAAVKARVTLIEAHKMGGDCLNYGCVPSKALIKSAKVAQLMRQAAHYGLQTSEPTFRFSDVMARVHAVIAAIEPHDSIERYTQLGVEVKQGHGRIVNPWTVEITNAQGQREQLTTRAIVIAAGARPYVPPIPGLNAVGYVTSDTLWEAFAKLDVAPPRLLVLGGGPIGCELAQSFARLGSQVTLVEMAPRLLSREDEDVSAAVQSALVRDGVQVLTAHQALRCGVVNGEKTINLQHQGSEMTLAFDALLCAVGRVARLEGYGLEALGIDTHRTVPVNEYLETLYPNIYAAGDVAGPYQLTHTAAHMAWYAAVNALFAPFKKFKVDYSVIPAAVFTDPEVARVGLNEQEARAKNIAYEVTHYGIDDLDRAIADGVAHGFVKVLTVPGKDRIVGATIVGEHAADLLAEFVLAMRYGLGLNKILSTIHIYPTLAESNKYAAGAWKRAHAPERVLRLLERFHIWRRG
jgi:pyruvate/2-oxoglutarate dehydrogenase complex dihydrolipoamide dehydrogenase (E3) component/uncharacterized membrane protein YdjX (TVP38/TMEM64 family)